MVAQNVLYDFSSNTWWCRTNGERTDDWMKRRMNEWMKKRTNEWTDRRTDGRTATRTVGISSFITHIFSKNNIFGSYLCTCWLQSHITQCPEASVSCSNDCGQMCSRRLVPTHLIMCPLRKECCAKCGLNLLASELAVSCHCWVVPRNKLHQTGLS